MGKLLKYGVLFIILLSVFSCTLYLYDYQRNVEQDYITLFVEMKKLGDLAQKNSSLVVAEERYQKALRWGDKIIVWPGKKALVSEIRQVLSSENMDKVTKGYVQLDGKWIHRADFSSIYTMHHSIEKETSQGISNALAYSRNNKFEKGSASLYNALENLLKYPWLNGKFDTNAAVQTALSFPENCTTPLHLAAMNNNVSMVKVLLESGANADPSDSKGNSPMYYAFKNDNIELVKLFLKNGADPHKPYNGDNPLHYAVLNDKLILAKVLLENGADPNRLDKGKYPLPLATKRNKFSFVELLLEAGADSNVMDEVQLTSLQYALLNQDTQSADVLTKHGAQYEGFPDLAALRKVNREDVENSLLFKKAHSMAGETIRNLKTKVETLETRTTDGMLLVSDEQKEKLQTLSQQVNLLCSQPVEGWKNIKDILKSATASLNFLSRYVGISSTNKNFLHMYSTLSSLAEEHDYSVWLISIGNYSKLQLKDMEGRSMESNKMTNATPFIFGEKNHLIMRVFPYIPNAANALTMQIFLDMLQEM